MESKGKAVEELAIVIRVRVEEKKSGMLVATSPDMAGLFVTHTKFEELLIEVPEVIKALLKAEREYDFDVWRANSPEPEERAWVAIPAYVADQAMSASV